MADKRARGEPVVRRTLNATLHELARSGYASLKVEDIAVRARVNKTTVYRRWPTKEALVRAALLSISDQQADLSIPDTGSVHEDLLVLSRRARAFTRTPEGQVTLRMVAAENPHSELAKIAESVRQRHDALPVAVLKRARARGQLRAGVSPALLYDVLRSACLQRIVLNGKLEERFMVQLLDLLLRGASADAAPEKPKRARRLAQAKAGHPSGSGSRSASKPSSA
ncbi:MAG: TetR/AcrR family transcriptional regulator [Polyangiaceae bacterium]